MKDNLTKIAEKIDVFNTVDGGVSMAFLNVNKEEDQFIISVKTPGVSKYAYHLELANKMILIYTFITITRKNYVVQVPSMKRHFSLPENVDSDEIYAIYVNEELKIIVPYNDYQHFRKRKIHIDYLS